jgi:hypothetical protein
MATLKALVHVAKLKKEFPKMSPEVIAHVLKEKNGDRDEAAYELAKLVLDYHKMKLDKKREQAQFEPPASHSLPPAPQAYNSYSPPPAQHQPHLPPPQQPPYSPPPQQQQQSRPYNTPAVQPRVGGSTLPPPRISSPPIDDELPPAPPGGGGGGGGGATVRALYDYQTGQPAKLDFHKGDVIQLTNDAGDAWWYGAFNGRQGKFPKTYVRRSEDEVLLEALYDFGEKDGHLRFRRGDRIVMLNRRKGSDWLEGMLERGDGVIGIFPVSYVKVIAGVMPPNE